MKAARPTIMLFVKHGSEREAADFYQRAFNFDRVEEYAHNDELLSVHMASLGLSIIVAGSNPAREANPALGGPFHPTTPGSGGMFLRLPVSNIGVVLERAIKAGAVVRDDVGPNDAGGQTAILLDPFNHLWALDEDVARAEDLAA